MSEPARVGFIDFKMKEIFDSIKSTVADRIKSPLFGSFSIAWLIFNWKAVLTVLLSDYPIELRIENVYADYYYVGQLLWYPLAASLLYVLGFPYINHIFDLLLNRYINLKNDLNNKREIARLDAQKDLIIKNIEVEEQKAEYKKRVSTNQEIKKLNDTIKEQEEKLIKINMEHTALRIRNKELTENLQNEQKKSERQEIMLKENLKESNRFLGISTKNDSSNKY